MLPYFTSFQIDIADNTFVPNTTLSIQQTVTALKQLKDEGLSLDSVTFDIHLMVNDYLSHFNQVREMSQEFRIGSVLIHYGVKPDMHVLGSPKPYFTIGLVLNPDDTVTQLATDHPNLSPAIIQIMSVYPGFQGASFIPEVLHKVDQIKSMYYRPIVLIDGSVNHATLPDILSLPSKPDIAGIGSYLTKTEDLPKRIAEIQSIFSRYNEPLEM